jgi:hypothetical protein
MKVAENTKQTAKTLQELQLATIKAHQRALSHYERLERLTVEN